MSKLSMVSLVSLLAATAITVSAQGTGTATLVGTVSDASGSVIAGASVTVRSVERAFVYEGETTAQGDYFIPGMTSRRLMNLR